MKATDQCIVATLLAYDAYTLPCHVDVDDGQMRALHLRLWIFYEAICMPENGSNLTSIVLTLPRHILPKTHFN